MNYGAYKPTRKVKKPEGEATFLGLLYQSEDLLQVISFEFDWMQESEDNEYLVIAKSDKALPPYALAVDVTMPGELRKGWQDRARAAFGSHPLVDACGQDDDNSEYKTIY